MAKHFSADEWKKIEETLAENPDHFGLPERRYGSITFGSFNIRKLGERKKRPESTWRFLAKVCSRFDLLAVQEIMPSIEGVRHLLELMGPDYGFIVSDVTGVFPGDSGLGERMGFFYNKRVVKRLDIATDVTYDRSKVLENLARNIEMIRDDVGAYSAYLHAYDEWLASGKTGARPAKPKVKLNTFISFIRQPFCVGFRILGNPGTDPYDVLAVNAHLYYGEHLIDRRQEFDALMEWLLARAGDDKNNLAPNYLLLGDLNLDFDNPETDRARIERFMKSFNSKSGDRVNVNFPFLDTHRGAAAPFRTNARLSQTFDHIGLFAKDQRFPTYRENNEMGDNPIGPDYGVFNFVSLFSQAFYNKEPDDLPADERKTFFSKFEHGFSDHMPIWLRMPLP